MSNSHNGTAGLHSFERNNYFYGKLLTVRDMATEQAYHSDVQRTLSRYVTDFGGICGLDVTSEVTSDEDGDDLLEVTVSEGLALDRCGRLVVVADEVTETLSLPVFAEEEGAEVETDTVSVYVEYEECLSEPVPVAKTESACDDECEDNRVIESAEVTVVPGEPDVDAKSVAEVDFPDPLELGETDDRFAERVSVRGDLEARVFGSDTTNTASLDFVFAEGLPPGTATLDLSANAPDKRITGRLSLPAVQFLDDDGLRVPDGTFDLTGTLSYTGENDQRSTEVTGNLEVRDSADEVEIRGTLDTDPQAPGESDFDLTMDRTDSGFSFEKSVSRSAPNRELEYKTSITIDIAPLNGDRLVTGDVSASVVDVSGDEPVEYELFTLETAEWEREDGQTFDGLFVDVPERQGADPTEADIDHLLAGMARSYYANEPRESCPEVAGGPILVGTVTRDGETWADTVFERGPLVYTNDMLYDVIARHVSDFENPHELKLEVGGGAVADGGPAGRRADAAIGIEGPAGPEGTVGLTSSDGSIDVRPDRGFQTLDLTADVAVDESFEQYHVYEQSLQATSESFTELVEDSHRVWAPQQATHLAFRVARTAMHALEEGVHESPTEYVEYLTGPHNPYYPEEQIPMGTTSPLSAAVQESISVVDLERALLSALDPVDEVEPLVPVRNYGRALETLEGHLGDDRSVAAKAPDVARAQHRVAAAAETVLDSHPAVVGGFEGTVAQPRVGRGVVPNMQEYDGLDDAIRYLRSAGGWTYLLQTRSRTPENALDDPVNHVTDQVPKPDSTGHKAAGIRLEVVSPPAPDRVDDIGPGRRSKFARVGIETVAELAIAEPEVAALITDVTPDTASEWTRKAASYCDAYVLTQAQDVGLLQAEAFAEVEMNLSGYLFDDLSSLRSGQLDEEQLERDLEQTSDDVIAPKYKNALLRLDWDNVRRSI